MNAHRPIECNVCGYKLYNWTDPSKWAKWWHAQTCRLRRLFTK